MLHRDLDMTFSNLSRLFGVDGRSFGDDLGVDGRLLSHDLGLQTSGKVKKKTYEEVKRGCGTVGKAAASDPWDLWFEPQH